MASGLIAAPLIAARAPLLQWDIACRRPALGPMGWVRHREDRGGGAAPTGLGCGIGPIAAGAPLLQDWGVAAAARPRLCRAIIEPAPDLIRGASQGRMRGVLGRLGFAALTPTYPSYRKSPGEHRDVASQSE